MNRVWIGAAVGLTVLGIASSFRATMADDQGLSDDPPSKYDLEYAKTYVQLAAARLQQAEQQNQRVPGTVPKAEVSDLQGNLELAKQLLTSTKDGERRGRPSVFLRLGQLAVVTAERNLAKAKAIKARSTDAVSEIDLRILELRVDMARLQLAAGQEAMNQSIDAELEWKIGVLYEEVIRLRDEVNRLKQRS